MNYKLLIGIVLSMFLLSASAFAYSNSDIMNYWSFDVDATDWTGDNDGNVTGATHFSSGGFNNYGYYDFNGVDQQIVVGNSYSNEFTLSFWANPDGTSTGNYISKDGESGGTRAIYLQSGNNEISIYYLWDTSDTIKVVATTAGTCNTPTGSWTNIQLVHTTTDTKTYVNGTLCATLTNSFTFKDAPTVPMYIGAKVAPSASYFDGQISRVAYMSTAFSAAEVTQLFDADGDPVAGATPFFTVTAENADTNATLTDITITLANGTTYTNATNSIVYTPFNDSSLRNFTVSVDNYFNQTFTNYNTTVNLQANLTQYAQVGFYNVWTNESLDGFVYAGVTGQVTNESSDMLNGFDNYTSLYTITNGSVFVPFNSSVDLVFSYKEAFFDGFAGRYTFEVAGNLYKPVFVTHNFTGIIDINQSAFQATIRFNATQVALLTGVSPANFTIGTTTVGVNETVYLDVGTYNATFSKTGWYSTVQSVTINYSYFSSQPTWVENYYNQTVTIANVSDAIINVTAYDPLNVINVSGFNVTITSLSLNYNQTLTTAGLYINVPSLQGYAFNITVSKSNYISNTTLQNASSSLINLTAHIYSETSVFFLFKDEITQDPISNVFFNLIGINYSQNFTSNTSDFNISFLPAGTYEIRYSLDTTDYRPRSYFFNVPLITPEDVEFTLYVINQTESQLFVRTITDRASSPYEGNFFELMRWYIGATTNTGAYEAVERAQIDNQGDAVFSAVPNTQAYIYRILDPDFNIIFTSDLIYLIDTSSEILVNVEGEFAESFKELLDISYTPITFNETSKNTFFSFSDSAQASLICLNFTFTQGPNEGGNGVCSTQNSATLTLTNLALNGTYNIFAYAIISGDQFNLDSYVWFNGDREGIEVFGSEAWMFILILFVVWATISFANPIIGIVGTVMTFVLFGVGWIGILEPVAAGVSITTLMVSAAIIIIALEKK